MGQSNVFKIVNKVFDSPITPYEFQVDVIERAKEKHRVLLRLLGGSGKTFCSIWLALYHSIENGAEQIICVVPAPLVTQWSEVWKQFPVNICAYQGTPTERRKMGINSFDVIVVSKNIFVKEWEDKEATGKLIWKKVKGKKTKVEQFKTIPGRIQRELASKSKVIIYDELQNGLRRQSNTIWKAVKALSRDQRLITLSATPISNPADVFAVLNIMGSSAYKSQRHFELKHVEKRDFFKRVIAWDNLDYMQKNIDEISITVPDSAYKELPEVVCDRVVYDLSKKHLKNYITLAEDKLLETDDTFIDATESENLWHVLQRYVTAPESSANKTMLELLKNYYEEDESSLVIFGNYQTTNRAILEYFGDLAVGKWGEFSHKQQTENLKLFYAGEKKILVGHPQSLGTGTDGIQNVCYRAAFAEIPITSVLFNQCIWRIHRDGQTNPCLVRAFTARGTIQMKLYKACLEKDDLVNQVIQNKTSLRKTFLDK